MFKFSPQGKLLLALGKTDKPGLGDDQFDKPTDVAFGPQGLVLSRELSDSRLFRSRLVYRPVGGDSAKKAFG